MNDINKTLPHVRLKFHIDHPSDEDCYALGYECAQSDIDESENPFDENTHYAEKWLEGWWAGFYGEEPIFDVAAYSADIPAEVHAANDLSYHSKGFFGRVLKISGAIAASAVVGYQMIDLVA